MIYIIEILKIDLNMCLKLIDFSRKHVIVDSSSIKRVVILRLYLG